MTDMKNFFEQYISGKTPLTDRERERVREDIDRERKQEFDRYYAAERQRRIEESGVPKRFWNESTETYIPRNRAEQHILDEVRSFIALPEEKILLLYGSCGMGKTHLGASIVMKCGGAYIQSMRLCIEYESASSFSSQKTRLQILDMYSSVNMLVIDEIGRAFKDSTEKEVLSYIICARYDAKLPTVLISNLSKKDIVRYFGMFIFDRMTESCISLEFKGESMRGSRRNREAVWSQD